MYVSKGCLFLPNITLEELYKKYNNECIEKAKVRLYCAILRKKGKSLTYIAKSVNKRESTVSDILRRFEKRGIDGCYAIKQKGQPPKLSKHELKKLESALREPPLKQNLLFLCWTTKLVAYYVTKTFNKNFEPRHLQRIIKSFGFCPYKTETENIRYNKELLKKNKNFFSGELFSLAKQDKRTYCWMLPNNNTDIENDPPEEKI